MWTILQNNFCFVYTYKGICYQGFIIANTDEYVQLVQVEVYDHNTLYMQPHIQISKEDIEVMGKVEYMDLEERLE